MEVYYTEAVFAGQLQTTENPRVAGCGHRIRPGEKIVDFQRAGDGVIIDTACARCAGKFKEKYKAEREDEEAW